MIDTILQSRLSDSLGTGPPASLQIERYFYREGFQSIAGIDEAGRGPLAGPVVAAAVIFPKDECIPGVTDSKLLSPRDREMLSAEIRRRASGIGIGVVQPEVIDRINILQATKAAIARAVALLDLHPDLLLIDGKFLDCDGYRTVSLVKGDLLCHSIAAASIVAKCERDAIMRNLHRDYPMYGFDKHMGYPTSEHRRAIARYGLSPVHRKTFRVKIDEEIVLSPRQSPE